MLVFVDTDTAGDSEVMRLYLSGQGLTAVCLTPGFAVSPEAARWSPDEAKVAVAAEDGLRLVDVVDGSSALLDSGLVSSPRWSPDSGWIAYTRWEGGHKLYKARADGTERVCLAQDGDYASPAWSPDGLTIVCEKAARGLWQLVLVDAETGEEQYLTNDYHDNTAPVYTPDGEWVYFNKTDHTRFRQVYRVRPTGEDEESVTGEAAMHGEPDVSPDGEWVCFTVSCTTEAGVFYDLSRVEVVSVHATQQVSLTDGNAERLTPAWGAPDSGDPDSYAVVYEEVVKDSAGGTDSEPQPARIRLEKVRLPRRAEEPAGLLPTQYVLHQNVPNPFRQRTVIRYGVPATGRVNLQVYDLTGRRVRVLLDEELRPGYYSAVWDARDNRGREMPAGVYFYELRTDAKVIERKMLYLK